MLLGRDGKKNFLKEVRGSSISYGEATKVNVLQRIYGSGCLFLNSNINYILKCTPTQPHLDAVKKLCNTNSC